MQELELPTFLKTEWWRICTVVLLLAAYIFGLIGRIPYIPATAIFVTAFIWIFKGGGWLKSLLIGLVTSVAVWSFSTRSSPSYCRRGWEVLP